MARYYIGVLAVVFYAAYAQAAPNAAQSVVSMAPAPAPMASHLPPLFTPGAEIPFSWWRGKDSISAKMIVEEVRGDWVRMHLQNDAASVWVYPPAMTAVWGASMQ